MKKKFQLLLNIKFLMKNKIIFISDLLNLTYSNDIINKFIRIFKIFLYITQLVHRFAYRDLDSFEMKQNYWKQAKYMNCAHI